MRVRRLNPRLLQHGGKQIERLGETIHAAARIHIFGILDDERRAHQNILKACRPFFGQAVIADIIAVVAEKQDERVVVQSVRFERFHHAPYLFVQFGDHAVIHGADFAPVFGGDARHFVAGEQFTHEARLVVQLGGDGVGDGGAVV